MQTPMHDLCQLSMHDPPEKEMQKFGSEWEMTDLQQTCPCNLVTEKGKSQSAERLAFFELVLAKIVHCKLDIAQQ